ncbi:MAG: PQQ-binding-like beta-propeller repeat protein, partial [Clostridia bacterium]|nr:PQQ-binding-like beta-propeller repeat protein [Clostridia bacterium]
PTPTPTPKPTPHAVAESNPENYRYVDKIEENGVQIDAQSYTRSETLTFPAPEAYSQVNGILTFRGNNWRNQSSFGTVALSEFKMTPVWHYGIGSLTKPSGKGSWSGCGWTGQPLIVEWPAETRRQMASMYQSAREQDGLVEVIYPTEDGNIYFFDLYNGNPTRDPIKLRVPFKGTGSIDPRGYPLLYVGSGDQYQEESQKSRVFVINLLTNQVIYEFGKQGTDAFAPRVFYAYDSAPLVDATTDTLIYPGENGVIYTMKLNTNYDRANGIISINPGNVVKHTYTSNISWGADIETADLSHKWYGYEGSAVAWNGYLYLSSNDGLFQCIDLNTFRCVWIADTLDDTNGSPVLDVISDTEAYLYVGTSLHFTKDKNSSGVAPFFKIDAMTGEIKWQYGVTVMTVSGVSGGIQATAVVGQGNLSDLVFIPIARYGGKDSGALVALDKETRAVRWQYNMEKYTWSSPAVVYTADGTGYILQADSGGNIFLLDGATGKLLSSIAPTDSNFEASPAVYGQMLIVGCRGDQEIFGIRLS